MKKQFKKSTALILAVIMTVMSFSVLTACSSGGDIPSGMKIASPENTGYSLFVPDKWKCDIKSGTSGAYYSDTDTSNVSVMSFSFESSDATVDAWWKSFTADFNTVYSNFSVESEEETVLDGVPAMKYIFEGTLTHNGDGEGTDTVYKFMQVAAINSRPLSSPEVFVFTYTSDPDTFDSHIEDVQLMLDTFKFD